MSGILKRTIYADTSNDKVRFLDWASVVTGVGQMAEPRCLMAQRPVDGVGATAARLDYTDDISRIDALEQFAMGKEQFLFSDGPLAMHGGRAWPRVGY